MLFTLLLAFILQPPRNRDLGICEPLPPPAENPGVTASITGGSGISPTYKVAAPTDPLLIDPAHPDNLYYPDIVIIEWAVPIDTASTGAFMRRFSPRPVGTLPFTPEQTTRACVVQFRTGARGWIALKARLDSIVAVPGVRGATPLYFADRR